ncbi:SusC/RagA family TonB-linked outer membrane protein [Puteibacter caeruleilacunae]|nr:SusC/RagA family TonB-linked outer membrane protein [Puteibacter caeruleilacunae]
MKKRCKKWSGNLYTRTRKILLVMKFCLIFMLIGVMQLSANVYSQSTRLNLSLKKVTLEEVLRTIERQSEYKFLYKDEMIDTDKEVSIEVKNSLIDDILKEVLDQSKVSYTVLENNLIVITPSDRDSMSQESKVIGTIVDNVGDPLPGVAVVVKGTTIGTVTDVNGYYLLTVPAGDVVLQYSFVGMKTIEMNYAGQGTIDITMEPDNSEIDEVVVVAYGTQSKSTLTGAVQSVDAGELTNVTTPNISNMIQSVATGVQVASSSGAPGQKASVRIRGEGSINYTNEPLWVVDGVIYGTSSPDINPNDIETISILKDAAAAALYGARASNGVILVKTKTGKANSSVFTLDVNTGITKLNQGEFKVMDGQQLYDYVAPMVGEGFDRLYQLYWDQATSWWGGWQEWWIEQKLGTTDKETYMNKTIPPADAPTVSNGTDWQDIAFKTGVVHDYNFSFRGGSEKTRMFASLGYYKEDGAVIGHDWEKFSGRFNIDYYATDRVKLTAKIGGVYQSRFNNENGALYSSFTYLPWDNPYFEDGSLKTGRSEVDGQQWYGRSQSNFLFSRQYNYSKSRSMQYMTDLGVEIKLTDWLTFSSNNRLRTTTGRSESLTDSRTPGGQADDGLISNGYSYHSNLFTSNLLRFDRSFNKHHVFGLVAYEYSKSYYDNLDATGKGIYPTLEIMNGASEPKAVGGTKTESAFLSVLSNVQYVYNKKYMVQGSFRRDGSSRFGDDQRYGNFWSVGASWAMHEEDFISDISWIDNMKLRGSYGSVGNANIGDFVALGLYNMTVQYNGIPGGFPRRLPNEDLTWESNYNTNIALDTRLFNRVNLTVDVYNRKTKNLLQDAPLPMVTGFYWFTENVGSIRNRGVEFLVNADVLEKDEFKWNVDFNISFNKNKVLKLNAGQDIIRSNKILREGWDMNTWYMKKWAGIDPENGDPLWEKVTENEDGTSNVEITNSYSDATLQAVGSSSPDYFGGFTNTFSYKGLSLIANFNYVSGNKIYHSSREFFDNDGAYPTFNSMVLHDGWSRWEKPGDQATHPKPMLQGNHLSNKTSSRYLEDGGYIRLRNVTLTYDLPGAFVKKLGFRKVRLKVSGDNLWTKTDFSGLDPEVGIGGDAYFRFPVTRKVMFGLNVQF